MRKHSLRLFVGLPESPSSKPVPWNFVVLWKMSSIVKSLWETVIKIQNWFYQNPSPIIRWHWWSISRRGIQQRVFWKLLILTQSFKKKCISWNQHSVEHFLKMLVCWIPVDTFLKATRRILQSTLIFSFVCEKVLAICYSGLWGSQIYVSQQSKVTSMHRLLVLKNVGSGDKGRV